MYVTATASRPGKPSSPSSATSDSRTPSGTSSASHTRLSKPRVPPCTWLRPSFRVTWCVCPSSTNEPPRIRFAYRPTRAPKYGPGCASYPAVSLSPSATPARVPSRPGTSTDCTTAPYVRIRTRVPSRSRIQRLTGVPSALGVKSSLRIAVPVVMITDFTRAVRRP